MKKKIIKVKELKLRFMKPKVWYFAFQFKKKKKGINGSKIISFLYIDTHFLKLRNGDLDAKIMKKVRK